VAGPSSGHSLDPPSLFLMEFKTKPSVANLFHLDSELKKSLPPTNRSTARPTT